LNTWWLQAAVVVVVLMAQAVVGLVDSVQPQDFL
jgi:hypothetical protein